MKKLSQIVKYKPLSKYEGLYGNIPCRAPTTFVGVELELEQVYYKYDSIPSTFSGVIDGSLRLDGMEFITIPIRFCYLEQELNRMFSSIDPPLISPRCSTHVHMNARDFTFDELHKFILLYMIFEKSLFKVADNRWNSEFCVPLYQSPQIVSKFLFALTHQSPDLFNWNKYFALNLCPIWGGESKSAFGTIEFRHMAGTTDTPKVINWINLIVSLKIAAKRMILRELFEKILTMNTTSEYYTLAKEVFREYSEQLVGQPTFEQDVESCITKVKSISVPSVACNILMEDI